MKHSARRIKRKKRKKILKKVLAVHTKITLAFFIFYLLVSLVVDPRFLSADFREKYSSIAATSQTLLSLHIIGPPSEPVVTTNWFCDNSGSYIQLDWNATEDTTSYDIFKDSVLLAASLTDQTYQDDVITENSSYTYQVVANGPLGSTSSDEITQTAGHCVIGPEPTIQIKSLDGKNIENKALPETTDHTPVFSGTTNIPDAIININLVSGMIILSSTTANTNGYWEWKVPMSLDHGDYQATFTATDPLDVTRIASATKNFRIVKEESSKKENKKEAEKTAFSLQTPPMSTEPLSFGLSVSVENADHIVYAGQDLILRLSILKKNIPIPNQDYKISYIIIDSENKFVLETTESINPAKNQTAEKKIKIPALAKNGNYKIVARIYQGNNIISGDDLFSVKELPIFSTSAISITPTDIMQNLGWLILTLLLILLFFLMLLGIEHHLSNEAIFQITENYLTKKGYISKRKGADR